MRKILISTTLVAAVTTMAADAQSFGINFRNGGNFTVNTGSGLTYSGVPANQWHNSSGNATATNEAVTAPAAPNVTVSYASSNTWGTNVTNDIGDGYLDDTNPGLMVTIKGLTNFLPAGQQYRVRALQSSDNATGFIPMTVYQGENTAGPVVATLTNPVTGSGGSLFGESNYSGALTADAITLKPAARAGTLRATLAGVVIEVMPPPVDHFENEGTGGSYATAPLGNGLTSTFRIGANGSDSVMVSQSGGLSVGTAPGNTHTIDIDANGLIAPGTYTLIDYEGAIGGAGFAGLVLGSIPHMNAELVDNTAESKIQLVINEVDGLQWTGSSSSSWLQGGATNWTRFSDGAPSVFFQGDEVNFDDGAQRGTVVIADEVRPAAMRFTNENLSYAISGGSIAGATGLELLTPGTVTLESFNTFTGAIKVSTGTLVSAGDGALGEKGLLELSDAATLKATVTQTTDRPLTVLSTGATIEVPTGEVFTHQGKIQFPGTLTKTGEGTLAFQGYGSSGAQAATDLVVNGGTVEFRDSFFNGAPLGGESFQATVNAGAVLRFTAAHSVGGDYWDWGTSLGRITVSGGALQIDGSQYLRKGLADNKGNFVLDGGTIQGSGAILSVTYNNPADDQGEYSTISVLPNAVTSEIVNAGGISTQDRSVKLVVEDGAAATDLLLDAPVTGANGLIMVGTGTLVFTGNATNEGTNQIQQGTFAIGEAASFGAKSKLDVASIATLRLDYAGTKTVSDFKIDGVSQAGGTWGRQGSGANHESALITGNGLLQVGSGANPFAQWISTNYPQLTGADAQPAADPDKDGLSNLDEFAFDGNPASGKDTGKLRSRVETVGGEKALVITLPVRTGATFGGGAPLTAVIDGVTYTIGGSNDLGAWTQTVAEIATSAADMPGLSAGWTYRSFRLSGVVPTRGIRGFLRATVQ